MDEIKEFIELKFIDIKKYIDDCFEEQSKNNSITKAKELLIF